MSKSLSAIGFLSILDRPENGILGGYLIVTPQGRPLEFHCSAPVQPNRAQEILYGPTLRPYLYGEIIGDSLLKNASLPVDFVMVDQWETLALRELIKLPVGVVLEMPSNAAVGLRFEFGTRSIGCAIGFESDQSVLSELLARDDMTIRDLMEPFERIQAAIEEAHRMAA